MFNPPSILRKKNFDGAIGAIAEGTKRAKDNTPSGVQSRGSTRQRMGEGLGRGGGSCVARHYLLSKIKDCW